MKNYLIPMLTQKEVKLLRDAGLQFYVFDSDAQSYIIEGQYFTRALELLNATLVKEENSGFEGIVKAGITYRQADPSMDPAEVRRRSRNDYIRACSVRIDELRSNSRLALVAKRKSLLELQRQSFSILRLDAFAGKSASSEPICSQLAAEFDRLLVSPRLQWLLVEGGKVMVKTETLYAAHPKTGQNYEIGEFLIVIELNPHPMPVRCYNGSRRVDGIGPRMNAPNVYADGTPTSNEIHEAILQLIAQLEISVAIDLAIQFIETVGSDTVGAFLGNWARAAMSQIN